MAAPCTSITDDPLAVLLEEIFLRLPTPAESRPRPRLRRLRPLPPDRHRQLLPPSLRTPPPPPPPLSASRTGTASAPRTRLTPPRPWPVQSPALLTSPSPSSLAPPATRCCQTPAAGASAASATAASSSTVAPKREYGSVVFPELVVCDPLHRRYRLLPPIPDDLAASVRDPLDLTYQRRCEVTLVPPGKEVQEDKEEYETSFRVIWMAQCKTKVVAFVYSSTTGQWQSIASKGWSDLLVCGMPIVSLKYRLFYRSHYAYGCLYWPMTDGIEFGMKDRPREAMLVLDTMTMEFSVADYPPGRWSGLQVGIVEAGEGRLALLTFSINDATSQLRYTVRQNTDGSNNEWQLEKIIPLVAGNHSIVGSTERYLLLVRLDFGTDHSEGLSLDVKTFQLERVCELSDVTSRSIYTSFPPSLSSRTV